MAFSTGLLWVSINHGFNPTRCKVWTIKNAGMLNVNIWSITFSIKYIKVQTSHMSLKGMTTMQLSTSVIFGTLYCLIRSPCIGECCASARDEVTVITAMHKRLNTILVKAQTWKEKWVQKLSSTEQYHTQKHFEIGAFSTNKEHRNRKRETNL